MSYLVLARKYRPQTFDQVVKQEHVTRTLTNAISLGRVPHAVLFSGPRGTGKTTVARILAKAMNCKQGPTPTPCNECRSCVEITKGNSVDVFEVDGASNNSVDQIRELRENIQYMPAYSTYKIYIIDEVHMLSISAFNALLKTLEEPPSHIMFMFATTEPHKIPITILSRCQRHDLRRINIEAICEHLQNLCLKEDRELNPKSIDLIARESGGSMRDALSLLDQIISCAEGTITHDHVLNLLGVIDRKIIFDITCAILNKDIPKILDIIDDVYDRGHDIKRLYSDIVEHFRNLLVVKIKGKQVQKLVNCPSHEIEDMENQVSNVTTQFLNQIFEILFKDEVSVKLSAQPKLSLEMVFMRLLQVEPVLLIDELIKKLDNLKNQILENQEIISTDKPEYLSENNLNPLKKYANVSEPQPKTLPKTVVAESCSKYFENPEKTWNTLLNEVSKQHPGLTSILKNSCLKKTDSNQLIIEVPDSVFNTGMINQNLNNIKDISQKLFGKDIEVEFEFIKKQNSAKKQDKKDENRLKQEALNHPLVADAIEIFNGKIVDVKIL